MSWAPSSASCAAVGWRRRRHLPEILLPVIVALVFVAAFEGEHDWGDLYPSLVFFGIVGWIMKRLGWPRPPMVLGIVVGGIFECYLFISTQLYGWEWLLRPAVLAILACVVWALYRPISQIVKTLIAEFHEVGAQRARFGVASAFSLAVIVLIVAAIASSANWPHDAKLVPLTACGMALVAATPSISSPNCSAPGKKSSCTPMPGFSPPPPAGERPCSRPWGGGRRRAPAGRRFSSLWMAGFIAAVALIGFIPAIALFVFAYMRFGFGEPWRNSLGFAAVTTLLCTVVFHWALQVAWPPSLLGDLFPALRDATHMV